MLEIKIDLHQVNDQFSVNNVNLKVKEGTIFALIGKSGSGKSTIAKITSGELICSNAEIRLDKINLNTNFERLIREFPEIGYVPQNLHLKPHHTTLAFLEMLFQTKPAAESKKIIQQLVKDFNLKSIMHSKIQHLSGGERQKLAIIQAIAKPIKALILDEPFSQLDTLQKQEIRTIMTSLIKRLNIPCLMISHDVLDVIQLSNQIGFMHKGKIVFKGDWAAFYKSKNAQIIQIRSGIDDYLKRTLETIQFLNTFSF